MNSIDILRELIAFATVSRDSNLPLLDYVQSLLERHGIRCRRLPNEDGTKANLFASTGPQNAPGIVLSGHSDVVPVDGQNWTVPPFELTEKNGRLYGRGSADMKGFVACAIHAMIRGSQAELRHPLQLALSYDEEIGCVGVRGLIDHLKATGHPQPLLCLVGEPTGLVIGTGHKGKVAARATCRGRAGHSAMAPLALNAIHLASDLVGVLRDEQLWLQENGPRDEGYDVPYSTVHVGRIHGGTALNIVPDHCTIDFELRHMATDDPQRIFERIEQAARMIERRARETAPEASIEFEIVNSYPGFEATADCAAVRLLQPVTKKGARRKVAFGTEAGLFSERLGCPTAICGPGSMAQGHGPDEYIERQQMDACDALLEKLVTFAKDPVLPAT